MLGFGTERLQGAGDGWRRGLIARLGGLAILAMLALTALPPAAQAQGPACTITWDGQLSSRWFEVNTQGDGDPDNDVYNWTPERYPNQTDHACIPSGFVVNTNQVTQNTPDVRSFAISAGATLTVTDVQVIARENSTNAGTLNMAAPVTNPANPNVVLTIGDAIAANGEESLTNTGVINFPPRATPSSPRAIISGLINQGTINVDTPEASIQRNAIGFTPQVSHSNTGTINISPGNSLRMIFANFVNGSGGLITGGGSMNMDQVRFENASGSQIVGGATPTDVNMTNSVLAGTVGSTATGNIDVFGAFSGGGPSTLEGAVPPGIVVDVEPGVTLRSPAVSTTVNAGRININGNGAQLQVLPNDPNVSTSKLTNTGTIEFTPSGSGFRFLTGDVVNTGSILVNHPEASFQFPGGSNSVPNLTNQGSLSISAGNTFRVLFATLTNATGGLITGNGTINNEQAIQNTGGTVAPGSSPGSLTFTGNYVQGPGGTLAIEVSGAAPGTGHDQLVVGGTANLAGTLSINTTGFTPATGQQFKIIDAPAPPAAPTVTGTFGTVQSTGGTTYAVAYNPTDVTLTAGEAQVNPPPPVNPPDDNAACDKAKANLAKAKAKLKKLKKKKVSKAKVKKASKKVKKAKAAVKKACA